MRKVLITGATGAIGMALLELLVQKNIETTVICRPGSARRKRIPQASSVHVIDCDLRDLKSLEKTLAPGYDVFYHLGWEATFGASRNDVEAQIENIQHTVRAVELAAAVGCKRFVGAGSQAEYGRYEGVLNASAPTFPENGYGAAKLCAGQLSRLRCGQLGLEHVWARILSVYGPFDGEKTMIMSTIGQLLQGNVPALTYGEQKWDYLYAKDAALALYLLGEAGKDGKVYCLGGGQARALREYVEILRDAIDPSLSLGFGALPYGERQVMYLQADIEDLRRDTGFEPQYTFRQGIAETIDWYRRWNKE